MRIVAKQILPLMPLSDMKKKNNCFTLNLQWFGFLLFFKIILHFFVKDLHV